MLDLRGYAGKLLLLGQLGSSYQARGFDLQDCYVLGTITAGQDLPATVKAIIEDLEAEAPEASEVLWVLQVNAQGTAGQRFPVVVFDDQARLRYGHAFLTAVADTGIGAQACVVRGVRFASAGETP
jgi:hypothetical protein